MSSRIRDSADEVITWPKTAWYLERSLVHNQPTVVLSPKLRILQQALMFAIGKCNMFEAIAPRTSKHSAKRVALIDDFHSQSQISGSWRVGSVFLHARYVAFWARATS